MSDARLVQQAWFDEPKLARELTRLLQVGMDKWEHNRGSARTLVLDFKGYYAVRESQGKYLLGSMMGGSPDVPVRSKREQFLASILHRDGSSKQCKQLKQPDCAEAGRIAFLFSPLGAAPSGGRGGRGLYESCPAFREAIDDCYACYMSIAGGMRLEDFLCKVFETSDEKECQLVWMFVVQYALFQAALAAGLEPAVVLGHSNGEFAAGVAAGFLSRDHAMRILIARVNAISHAEEGSMASVKASVHDVTDALQVFKGGTSRVVVAAINSPYDTVVSGPSSEVERFCSELNHFTIWLDCDFDVNFSPDLHDCSIAHIEVRSPIVAGAIAAWNEEHPTCQVEPGDRVVKVDGKDFRQWTGPVGRCLTLVRSKNVPWTKLKVPTAMHSSLVSFAVDEVHAAVKQCDLSTLTQRRCQMVSSSTADLVQDLDASFWSSQDDVKPVRFMQAIRRVTELGCSKFLELGVGKLLSLGKRCVDHQLDSVWLAALNEDEVHGWEQAVSELKGYACPCPLPSKTVEPVSPRDHCAILEHIFHQAFRRGVALTDRSTLYCLGLDSFRVELLCNNLRKEGFQCDMQLGR